MDMANHPAAAGRLFVESLDVAAMFANVPDPDLAWAERNPDRALAFLYVSPRPCEALDRLLNI